MIHYIIRIVTLRMYRIRNITKRLLELAKNFISLYWNRKTKSYVRVEIVIQIPQGTQFYSKSAKNTWNIAFSN